MKIIVAGVIAFITTNIDDVFILVLMFSNRALSKRNVVAGQYAGIATLIVISLLGSAIGLIVDPAYIGLLGLMPIYLGCKAAWHRFQHHDSSCSTEHDELKLKNIRSNFHQVISIAGVTVANGGDNIGVYVPLFAPYSWYEQTIVVAVFLVMTACWCAGANYLLKHPVMEASIDRYGHMVVPFVFILLGIFILYESGTFHWAVR